MNMQVEFMQPGKKESRSVICSTFEIKNGTMIVFMRNRKGICKEIIAIKEPIIKQVFITRSECDNLEQLQNDGIDCKHWRDWIYDRKAW